MTTGKNILIAKNINYPNLLVEADLSTLTYKWDQVPVENFTEYANKYEIPYKELFSDMDRQGLLYPVIIRDLKSNGVFRKYQCGGRRIIWAKRNGYTHISAYNIVDWLTEKGRLELNEIVQDQWFRID
tara:strand:+ start:233 stop:616 length:384 start_codon:yes stop_codon:yes gene_type:complete